MTADPLAQLRDIHLPETISWWPPAIGWWLLVITIISAIAVIIYCIIRRKKQQRYRKEAIALLDECYREWSVSKDNSHCFSKINGLLKRTAITAFPGSEANKLHGRQWLEFLNEKCPTDPFDKVMMDHFSRYQYQREMSLDIKQFYHCSHQWIQQHANV